MPIADLVQLYFEEGKAEHVRPELAFAQSIIETGSFGNALDNNYAGIGACDSCKGEPAFPTPRDGVRGPDAAAAQLRRPDVTGRQPRQPAVADDLRPRPRRAPPRLYDTFFAKGRTPTWNVMGNGNWATDPGYSQKVLTVYFQMVSFAAKHSERGSVDVQRPGTTSRRREIGVSRGIRQTSEGWAKQRSARVPSTRSR